MHVSSMFIIQAAKRWRSWVLKQQNYFNASVRETVLKIVNSPMVSFNFIICLD